MERKMAAAVMRVFSRGRILKRPSQVKMVLTEEKICIIKVTNLDILYGKRGTQTTQNRTKGN